MEAFFVAVALEMGTRTGGKDCLDARVDLGLPTTPEEREEMYRRLNEHVNLQEFMKGHPGAPPVLQRVRRAHRESGGGLGRMLNEEAYFWGKLVDAYLIWCSEQPAHD